MRVHVIVLLFVVVVVVDDVRNGHYGILLETLFCILN